MKKPAITVAEFKLGRDSKPEPEEQKTDDGYGEEDSSTATEAMRAACADVMRAFKRNDEQLLCDALAAFVDAKDSEEKSESPEEERGEDGEE